MGASGRLYANAARALSADAEQHAHGAWLVSDQPVAASAESTKAMNAATDAAEFAKWARDEFNKEAGIGKVG